MQQRRGVPALTALAILQTLLCAAAGAQSTDDVVHVTAYRIPVLLERTTQAVSVITREEIEARNPASAAALFEHLPGVHVDRLSGTGLSNIYVRGAEPNHTLILMDGARVNDPTDTRGGGYDLSTIDVSQIERIEVLRGGDSARFGADAMGGVVNIVTRRGRFEQPLTAQVEAGAGTESFRRIAGRASGGTGMFAYNLGAARLEDGRRSEGGDLELNTYDGSLRIAPSETTRLRIYARHADHDNSAFPEFSGGVRFAQLRELEERSIDEQFHALSGTWQATSSLSWAANISDMRRDEARESPGVAPGPGGFLPQSQTRSELTRRGGSLSFALHALPYDSTLSVGAEYWREEGRAGTLLMLGAPMAGRYDLERDTRSFFTQLDINPLQPLQLSLAARHDDIEKVGAEFTSSAGLRWQVSSTSALRLHWSEGFKPPSFYALGDPLVGNRDLQPEHSESWEAGLQHTAFGGRGTMEITAFRTHYRDLVDFDPDLFRLVNRSEVRARGFEVGATLDLHVNVRVLAAYAYVAHDLTDSIAVLRNRPRHRASLRVHYQRGSWSTEAAARYIGSMHDESIPTGPIRLKPATTMDARIAYGIQQWTFALAVDDVFNARHESFAGFEPVGRRIRVSVRRDI